MRLPGVIFGEKGSGRCAVLKGLGGLGCNSLFLILSDVALRVTPDDSLACNFLRLIFRACHTY